jgi:regulatory protein
MSAQRLLARREHSRKELLQKLQAKEYAENDIETVLNELANRGWQDDRKFCEAFIRFRVLKGQGPQKIIHELKNKGVATQIIAEEMQMYDAQWLQLCENVASKKYGSVKITSIEDRAKRFRFLSTRGFPSEIVRQVLVLY